MVEYLTFNWHSVPHVGTCQVQFIMTVISVALALNSMQFVTCQSVSLEVCMRFSLASIHVLKYCTIDFSLA
jgi:hypothetical protein